MKGLQSGKMITALCSLSKYKPYYIDLLCFVKVKLVVNTMMKKCSRTASGLSQDQTWKGYFNWRLSASWLQNKFRLWTNEWISMVWSKNNAGDICVFLNFILASKRCKMIWKEFDTIAYINYNYAVLKMKSSLLFIIIVLSWRLAKQFLAQIFSIKKTKKGKSLSSEATFTGRHRGDTHKSIERLTKDRLSMNKIRNKFHQSKWKVFCEMKMKFRSFDL